MKIFSWLYIGKLPSCPKEMSIENRTTEERDQMRRDGLALLYKAFIEETGLPPSRMMLEEDWSNPTRATWKYREYFPKE